MLKIILIVIGFISGLLFCLSYNTKDLVEGFDNPIKKDCPNILVQKGNKIELTNTRKAKVPGVNPIYFDNLDEYTEFIKWQKANGINCPILAFKETIGANGENMFSISKELSSGKGVVMPQNLSYSSRLHPLYDANSDDPPFNQGPYHGFDEEDQNIGIRTKLDKNGGLGTFNKSYRRQGSDFLYGNYDEVVTQKTIEGLKNLGGETPNQRICLDAVRPKLGAGLNRAFEPYQRNNLGNNQKSEKKHHDQITGLIQAVNNLSSNMSGGSTCGDDPDDTKIPDFVLDDPDDGGDQNGLKLDDYEKQQQNQNGDDVRPSDLVTKLINTDQPGAAATSKEIIASHDDNVCLKIQTYENLDECDTGFCYPGCHVKAASGCPIISYEDNTDLFKEYGQQLTRENPDLCIKKGPIPTINTNQPDGGSVGGGSNTPTYTSELGHCAENDDIDRRKELGLAECKYLCNDNTNCIGFDHSDSDAAKATGLFLDGTKDGWKNKNMCILYQTTCTPSQELPIPFYHYTKNFVGDSNQGLISHQQLPPIVFGGAAASGL